jgi:hypothetical protein
MHLWDSSPSPRRIRTATAGKASTKDLRPQRCGRRFYVHLGPSRRPLYRALLVMNGPAETWGPTENHGWTWTGEETGQC